MIRERQRDRIRACREFSRIGMTDRVFYYELCAVCHQEISRRAGGARAAHLRRHVREGFVRDFVETRNAMLTPAGVDKAKREARTFLASCGREELMEVGR